MNILCIGNSFSQDATRYLHQISNDSLYVRNLFIGGCSLKTHADNIKEEKNDYEYQKNGRCLRKISINEALKKRKWDYITLQQASHFSGMSETYEPYLGFIISYIKEKCPETKIAFHRTWAYEDFCTHEGFANYGNDRKVMFSKIVKATEEASKKYKLPVIQTAEAVEKARELDEFRTEKGGTAITRDGFHLSLDYGRYLAGLVLFRFFTGKAAKTVVYEPEGTLHETNEKLKKTADG